MMYVYLYIDVLYSILLYVLLLKEIPFGIPHKHLKNHSIYIRFILF